MDWLRHQGGVTIFNCRYGVLQIQSVNISSQSLGFFLIGFGFGALFARPLSERFGRNLVFIGSWAFYVVCITGSSLFIDPGVQLSFRFMAGFFWISPPNVWRNIHRKYMVSNGADLYLFYLCQRRVSQSQPTFRISSPVYFSHTRLG